MAYTIDTHAAVRDLTASGLPAEQAEAIVATISRADDAQRADLATKADLAELKADLVARIDGSQAAAQGATADLRTQMNTGLGNLEIRLLKWGIAIALAIAGLLFAALRLTG
jgi:hypothetical protein